MSIEKQFDGIINGISRAFEVNEDVVRGAVERSYRYLPLGNIARVQKVLEKAKKGEKLTVCGLGGSITEGASAKTWANGGGNNKKEFTDVLGGEEACWFRRVCNWIEKEYGVEIESFNAGIGATPSFLGVHRMKSMVLDKNPDLVFLEFSVNDPSVKILREKEIFSAYECAVRRILESGAALIMVFMVEEKGTSFKEYHSEIGAHYGVPMVSYHDAVYPDECITAWRNLSPDEIHPNNAGHALVATCIENLFKKAENSEKENLSSIPNDTIYPAIFSDCDHIYASKFEFLENSGFELIEKCPMVSPKWLGTLVSEKVGDTVSIKVPAGAKRVYLSFQMGDGKIEYCFAGEKKNFDLNLGGWPRILWTELYEGTALEEEKVLKITNAFGKVMINGLEITY